MNYLQLPYDFIAHYIGRFSRKIPNGVRRAILRGLCFVCAFYFPLKYTIGSHNILKDDYLRSYIYAAVILVFCICLSDGLLTYNNPFVVARKPTQKPLYNTGGSTAMITPHS